jgi:integrase
LTDGYGGRRDVLLGKHDTPESRAEYGRVIAEWEALRRRPPAQPATRLITVNELLLDYWHFAEGYYRKNGEPTTQLDRVKRSLHPVKDLYGHTLVKDFGPLALKAVREQMIKLGWVRKYINSCIGCVKRAFKWGVENELIPSSVYHGLQAVEGLKRGRSHAPESKPVRPVPDEHVDAVLPFLTRPVRAMVQVQRLTGMRPGEVVIMRLCDIDRSSNVWQYRPESHKTEHHDKERVVFLGPQAQAVIQPFLFRDPGAFLFSPKDAMSDFRDTQRKHRKTKVQPSQQDRRKSKPRKGPGDHYTVTGSYGHAVATACRKVGVPHWHPNQLRHSKGTAVRRHYGIEAAQVTLGQANAQVTQIYAERDMALAARVAGETG